MVKEWGWRFLDDPQKMLRSSRERPTQRWCAMKLWVGLMLKNMNETDALSSQPDILSRGVIKDP
ncbi:MAG: hypothetical protein AMK69_16450 [Nitrospira bacterium SG8_3]|nr:MAG: hypothetical protein AMK69_16450 [Nitrospira bacterium SG8_3]